MSGLSKATTRRMYGLHMHHAGNYRTLERDDKPWSLRACAAIWAGLGILAWLALIGMVFALLGMAS